MRGTNATENLKTRYENYLDICVKIHVPGLNILVQNYVTFISENLANRNKKKIWKLFLVKFKK